jgi:hypothetical protein
MLLILYDRRLQSIISEENSQNKIVPNAAERSVKARKVKVAKRTDDDSG